MTTTLSVGTELELNQAIATVDSQSASGAYVIRLTANIRLGTDTGYSVTYDSYTLSAPDELYALNLHNGATVTIDGQNHSIDGGVANGNGGEFAYYRGLFVYSGTVTIQNLTIQNTKAQGGEGWDGGGGGAGLGGGLFIANDSAHGAAAANVTLDNVNFINNAAKGGLATYLSAPHGSAGAGGGLGGINSADSSGAGEDGGAVNGGGGIGSTAHGGDNGGPNGGTGLILGAASGGAGVANGNSPAGVGGLFGGGGGATSSTNVGQSLADNASGGGGVGGQNATSFTQGGAGGFGGGGGEAASGGFGGGGGEGGSGTGRTGGTSLFGGGGGGGDGVAGGLGGFGGGHGGTTHYSGGGGLGAGGAIFVQEGASLTYKGGSITGGSVAGGLGQTGTGATNGQAYGAGIFLQGNETITFAPTAGETLTISSIITDQASNGGTGVGKIVVSGAGSVQLGDNVHVAGGVAVGGGATLVATTIDSGGNVTNLGSGLLAIDSGTLKNGTGTSAYVNNPISVGGGGATIDANGHSFFLYGPLSGTGPLTFTSTGQGQNIGLGVDNHNFTGTTIVNAGVKLEADGDGAYSSGSAFTVNGGLDLNGYSQTIGSLAGGGYVTNSGGLATLTAGGNGSSMTYSGSIDPSGFDTVHLTKAGLGTLTLTGSSSLSGGLTIATGTVAFANADDTVTLSGAIDGSGILRKQGGETLILTGPTHTRATRS